MTKFPSILALACLWPAACTSVPGPLEASLASIASLSEPLPAAPRSHGGHPRRRSPSYDGTVSLLFGRRSLDDEAFWSPVEEHALFGLEAEFRFGDSPVGLELGLQPSADTATVRTPLFEVDVDAVVVEAYVGPRITLDLDEAPLSFYAGAGLNVVATSATLEIGGLGVDDDDDSTGGYAHIGAQIWVGHSVAVGVDFRAASGTDVTLFGSAVDADYKQAAVVLAFSF